MHSCNHNIGLEILHETAFHLNNLNNLDIKISFLNENTLFD